MCVYVCDGCVCVCVFCVSVFSRMQWRLLFQQLVSLEYPSYMSMKLYSLVVA